MLIERIIHIAPNLGDLILDSFIGSATKLAVAHKMNQKYIGIEMGEHAYTHCKVRLGICEHLLKFNFQQKGH